MTDIVERLKDHYAAKDTDAWMDCIEAANEIERLRADADFNYLHGYESAKSDYRDQLIESEAEIERLKDGEARLRAEVKVWVNHTKTAVWSDSEEGKVLARINAALIETPTVDINVVVPDRDYSAMTPKDCYEAGLLDGVYQAREAIKAAVRAALEGKDD